MYTLIYDVNVVLNRGVSPVFLWILRNAIWHLSRIFPLHIFIMCQYSVFIFTLASPVPMFHEKCSRRFSATLHFVVFFFFICDSIHTSRIFLLYCSLNGRIKNPILRYIWPKNISSQYSMAICCSPLTWMLRSGASNSIDAAVAMAHSHRHGHKREMNEWMNFDSVNRKLFTHQKSKCNDSHSMEIKSK